MLALDRPVLLGAVVVATVIAACDGEHLATPSEPVVLAAYAAAPTRAPLITDFVVPFTFTSACPQGFTLINSGTADIHQVIFFDAQGAPVRTHAHFILRATSVNATTGKKLRNWSQFTIFEALVAGTTSLIGGQMHITEPAGIIVQDAGKITFDAAGNVIFEAGTPSVQQRGLGGAAV